MEEGRLAGLAAAEALGHVPSEEGKTKRTEIQERLAALRMGTFGEKRALAIEQILNTEARHDKSKR